MILTLSFEWSLELIVNIHAFNWSLELIIYVHIVHRLNLLVRWSQETTNALPRIDNVPCNSLCFVLFFSLQGRYGHIGNIKLNLEVFKLLILLFNHSLEFIIAFFLAHKLISKVMEVSLHLNQRLMVGLLGLY